jgi:RHS repeat-associated protein
MGMGNVIAETDMSGNPVTYYLHGQGLEARILPNGTTEYYVSDYRGNVVAMVDASTSANITHKYQYDDFGKILQQTENDYNPFRYVGKYGVMYFSDNLYYMRARFYDPTIGRFLSEDPIWSTNLYPYADNNPVMGIDPDGHKAKWVEDFDKYIGGEMFKDIGNAILKGADQLDKLRNYVFKNVKMPEIGFKEVDINDESSYNPFAPVTTRHPIVIQNSMNNKKNSISSNRSNTSVYIKNQEKIQVSPDGKLYKWVDNKIIYIKNSTSAVEFTGN